jgi:hypothetical protein
MEQAGLPAPVVGAVLSIQEKFVQGLRYRDRGC